MVDLILFFLEAEIEGVPMMVEYAKGMTQRKNKKNFENKRIRVKENRERMNKARRGNIRANRTTLRLGNRINGKRIKMRRNK